MTFAPYMGHPAYKKIGGRVGYSILNGLIVGTCGMFGVFSLVANYIPHQVISPVLISALPSASLFGSCD